MTDITSHILATQQTNGMQVAQEPQQGLNSEKAMRAAAVKFEATFLAEMLKHSGLGQMPETFNGGPGEAGFSDFMAQEYAHAIASTRSTGLSDHIYRALKERSQP